MFKFTTGEGRVRKVYSSRELRIHASIEMATDLLSYAGWYFLPNLVTSYAQSTLYTVFIRAGDPKPPPGSTRYIRDRKRIHTFVILAYLLYTIYEVDHRLRQTGDFYQVLGVPHDVDERAIQSKFRRL